MPPVITLDSHNTTLSHLLTHQLPFDQPTEYGHEKRKQQRRVRMFVSLDINLTVTCSETMVLLRDWSQTNKICFWFYISGLVISLAFDLQVGLVSSSIDVKYSN